MLLQTHTMVGGSFNGGKITIGSGNNIFTANKDWYILRKFVILKQHHLRVNMLGDVVANSITNYWWLTRWNINYLVVGCVQQ